MRVSRWGNITWYWGLWFIPEQLRFFIWTLVGRVFWCVFGGGVFVFSFFFFFFSFFFCFKNLCEDLLKSCEETQICCLRQIISSLLPYSFKEFLSGKHDTALQMLFWLFCMILELLMCLIILFIVNFYCLLGMGLSAISWVLLEYLKPKLTSAVRAF